MFGFEFAPSLSLTGVFSLCQKTLMNLLFMTASLVL